MNKHFRQKGRYPENLDVLGPEIVKYNFPTCDPNQLKEKELELLSHFEYSSDGSTYTLIWSYESKYDSRVNIYKQYGRDGITGKTEKER